MRKSQPPPTIFTIGHSTRPIAEFVALLRQAGVNLLGHALAKEGAPHHIRVHTVAPAATETAMFRKLLTPEQFPKDRTLDPVEVGRVIADCVCGSLTITSGEVVYVHKM